MQVTLNTHNNTAFTAHGERNLRQIMNKLYKAAYSTEISEHSPDIIQLTSKMNDGNEVSGIAYFEYGQYRGLSFPYEMAHYRREFCQKLFDKYNMTVTKGKYRKQS